MSDRETCGRLETKINGGLTLSEYREGIRFGTDALLLAAFAAGRIGTGSCADFGTGSGVLPLLLLAGGSQAQFLAVELQEKYAALAQENAERNGFAGRMQVLCGDLREYRRLFPAGSMHSVVCNPPYLPVGCGKQSLSSEKRMAWHEDCLRVDELAAAAAWALQSGGRFFCVYLPSRMATLFCALRERSLEPKRLQMIAPSPSEKPSLFLLEAKKDAHEGMNVLPTLFLYQDKTHREESGDMQALYLLFDQGASGGGCFRKRL